MRAVRRVQLRTIDKAPVNGVDIPAMRDSSTGADPEDTDLTIIAEPGRRVRVIVTVRAGRRETFYLDRTQFVEGLRELGL